MNYVIIGNSVAAVGAIRGIRSIDQQGNITVISRERHVAYGRPLISYLLGGLITEKRMAYLPEDFYEKNRVNLLLNAEVVGVDTAIGKVTIAGGDVIAFDKLLVATGGDPFVPPIEGMAGKDRVFTFTTWDDAAKLKGIADDIRKVVVIGGGLIGLKAAEGLHLLNKKITIVELADRILSAAFDRPAGRVVAKKMKANGIDVITEDTVIKIEGDGAAITGVTLKSGDFIPCDTVIVAIGVRPAAALNAVLAAPEGWRRCRRPPGGITERLWLGPPARRGLPADIFVPASAPPARISLIEGYGACLHLVEGFYGDALAASREFAAGHGSYHIDAYDATGVVAGQSTLGMRMHPPMPMLRISPRRGES